MIITETRKAIIELIESFMDKTLSEGCLVNATWGNTHFFIDLEEVGDFEEITKIHGHYDITAVLKYFEEHFYSGGKLGPNIINIEKDYIEIREIKELCKCDIPKSFTIIGKFPNKPLYLYTEEEDKNLLELLKNLGKQSKT